MAFIIGKKQDGKTYYYLAESARVNGKPRIVSQRYLGSAEEIAARLSESGPGEPDRSRHLAFGDVAATWEMLRRLGVARIVDEVVGPDAPMPGHRSGPTSRWRRSTGWSIRAPSSPSPTGGTGPPATAGCGSAPERSTIGAFGTR
jgi:hypothetical protein